VSDNTATFYSPKELVVRSSVDTAALLPSLRRIIQKGDPELPISAVRTLRHIVDLQAFGYSIDLYKSKSHRQKVNAAI
jgi:hypothetical protein